MSELGARNTCVDRQTLYEELWQKPGTELAKKYGVSDVALGKACRRHYIPRPPPGYWTQRKHGYEVERTPLPPITDPRLQNVEFHPMPVMLTGNGSMSATSSAVKPIRTPIQISDDLSSPHPLVEAARKQLRSATGDDSRLVHTNPETALNISVAAATITRALKIMDALIRGWEAIGGSVKPGIKSFQAHHSTAFAIGQDEVLVSLRERTEPIPNWKPPKESYWHRYPPHRPSGKLAFSIEYYQRERLRSTWADGQRQRLEDILESILDGLLAQIEDEKSRRLDRQCEARQKAAAESRRTSKQKHDEEEKHRREGLAKDVDNWHQAERIRSYLAAMRHALDSGKARANNEKAFAEWFEWAAWYADHIDPLVRARVRPQPVQQPVNKPFAELDFTSRTKPVIIALGVSDSDALFKITEEQIGTVEKEHGSRVWSEVCRILEGLGYNLAGRRYYH